MGNRPGARPSRDLEAYVTHSFNDQFRILGDDTEATPVATVHVTVSKAGATGATVGKKIAEGIAMAWHTRWNAPRGGFYSRVLEVRHDLRGDTFTHYAFIVVVTRTGPDHRRER